METLRWELWENNPADKPPNCSFLPPAKERLNSSWNNSFRRSCLALAKMRPAPIRITKRKLMSVDEVLKHLPNKTLSSRTRHLRKSLLPNLLCEDNPHFKCEYTKASHEIYFRENSHNPCTQASLRAEWSNCEAKLIDQFQHISSKDQRDTLFKMIAKGKELFKYDNIRVGGAFSAHVDSNISKINLPDNVITQLKNLCDLSLPEESAGHLNLKSWLYSVVNFGSRSSSCRLKDPSKAYLVHTQNDIVKHTQGYVAPTKRGQEVKFHGLYMPPVLWGSKCPELDKLIDHSALQPFQFLSLP